jgi:hypothetical protein
MAKWREVTWRRWCVRIGWFTMFFSLLYLVWILPARHARVKHWPTREQWQRFGLFFAAGTAIYCVGYTWDDPYKGR